MKANNTATTPGFIISTVVHGKNMYITGEAVIFRNRYRVCIDQDINEAKPFATVFEANTYMQHIYNPHNREYTISAAMVKQSDLQPVSIPAKYLAA